jgi:ABC-type transporter Mla MlaB component
MTLPSGISVGVRDQLLGTITSTAVSALQYTYADGYVLELYDPGPPGSVRESFVFPIAPTSYELSDAFTQQLTPTEGNSVVAEEYGVILREITLEGTFGLSSKRAGSSGPTLKGNEHFDRLKKFFRAYSDAKQDATSNRLVQMRFHAMRDDDHFIVVPKQFAVPRNAKTRVHKQYRIQLTAIGRIDSASLALPAAQPTDAFHVISQALNDARGRLVDLTNATYQIKAKLSNIATILNNVSGLIRAVGNYVRTGSDLIFYPWKLALQTVDMVDQGADDLAQAVLDSTVNQYHQAVRDLRHMHQAISRILQFPERFQEGWQTGSMDAYAGARNTTQQDYNDGTAGATAGVRFSVAYGSESEAGLYLPNYNSLLRVDVDRTTTLQKLSAQYGVPPEAIALVNDLRAPYFAPGGGPGLLGPGDQVLIPQVESGANTAGIVGSPIDYRTPDEILFGRDLALDQELLEVEGLLDFVEDVTHDATDAEYALGVDAVTTALAISMATVQGTTTFLPDVGVVSRVGSKGVLSNVLLASLSLREAVLSDPRVAEIEKMEVVLQGDALYQEITPRLIDGRAGAPIATPISKVQG